MRQTVVHIPSFQGPYKAGLVFAMIEGLHPGEAFKLVCDQDPLELVSILGEARVPGLDWNVIQENAGRWVLLIQKAMRAEAGGCCGICGGNKSEIREQ